MRKKIMGSFLITALLLVNQLCYSQTNYGGIKGKIIHRDTLIFLKNIRSNVYVYKGKLLWDKTITDTSDHFELSHLSAGNYTLKIFRTGYETIESIKIVVLEGKIEEQNFHLKEIPISDKKIRSIRLVHYPQLVNPNYPGSQEISRDQLRGILGR